jgi:hypothetical protein
MIEVSKIIKQSAYINHGYGTSGSFKDTFFSVKALIWYTECCKAFAKVLLSCKNNYHHQALLLKQKDYQRLKENFRHHSNHTQHFITITARYRPQITSIRLGRRRGTGRTRWSRHQVEQVVSDRARTVARVM